MFSPEMKKILLQILFLTSFFSLTFAQNDFSEIKGIVTCSDWRDTGVVRNAEIVVRINDTLAFKVLTKEDGTYSLKLKKFKGSVKVSVEISKKTKSSKKNQCGFLANKDLRLINDVSKRDIYIVDFSLIPVTDCVPPPPTIYFKPNSLDLSWDKSGAFPFDMPPDSAFQYMASLLNENPGLILELSGHTDSDETKIDNLSLKRAQFVKDKLVSLGINGERLQPKAYGPTRMLISDEVIKKAKKKEERCALRQKNRRVTFLILSFDYK
jgi:hypothetical protein